MTRFPSPEQWAELEASVPQDRVAITAGWSFAAQQEHASIASFSKFSLELMAVGAPPSFLSRAHKAALDEIDHARMSFRIASVCAGQPLGPGPLPFSVASISETMTLQGSAIAAALDGCLNETIAALEAVAAAEGAKVEAVQLVLEEIGRDEQAHAELAWEYVAWAIGLGGPTLREAIRSAVESELRAMEFAVEPQQGSDLSAWGLLEPGARFRLRVRSTREVLRPAFARLLHASV